METNKHPNKQEEQGFGHCVLQLVSYLLCIAGVVLLIVAVVELMRINENEYAKIEAGGYASSGVQFLFYGLVGKCLHDIRAVLIGKKEN